jgi:hypothetical protein
MVAAVTVSVTVVVCVKPPPVPVTVMVKPPVGAVLLAANVSVLVPLVLVGLNEAVTPVGTPEAVRATLLLKPFWGVTVMELVPLDPCDKFTVAGEADSAKFGAPFTVSWIVAEPVRLPEVPVIVTVAEPVVAALLAESVTLLPLNPLFGLNEAVTPAGKPEAEKVTIPLKPPKGCTEIALLPFPPCTSVMLPSEAARLKPWIGLIPGQLFSKLSALMDPIPVAKSQPMVVP